MQYHRKASAIEANKRAQEAQKTIPITANKKITTK